MYYCCLCVRGRTLKELKENLKKEADKLSHKNGICLADLRLSPIKVADYDGPVHCVYHIKNISLLERELL